jgi:Kef-type K+ transport system membrane component KefB
VDTAAQTYLTLGVLLLIGLVADEGSRRLRLPNVTILLALGILIGPEALDLLPPIDDWFTIASTLALTMVGFLLGGSFTAEHLRTNGPTDLVIASSQGLMAAGCVSLVLWAVGVDPVLALSLGGIAVATDPAATLAVIQQRRADGPFTRTLLAITGMDDVIALALFAVLITTASGLTTGNGGSLLIEVVWEIVGAVVLGLALGLPAAYLTGRLSPGLPTQEEAYGIVLLCAGLALVLDVSFLLAAVVLGATIANRASHHEVPFQEIERIEWPALVVFFLLAGVSLDVSGLSGIGWIGAAYVILRSAGKVLGCIVGGRLTGLPAEQHRWLGPAMLPQAGVAIGLSLLAADRFPDIAEDLVAVAIAATVIFELVGPIFTKVAVDRLGESGRADGPADLESGHTPAAG